MLSKPTQEPTKASLEEAKRLVDEIARYQTTCPEILVTNDKLSMIALALDKARAEGVMWNGADSESRYREILQMIEESPTRVATAYLQYEEEVKSLREESAKKLSKARADERERAAKKVDDNAGILLDYAREIRSKRDTHAADCLRRCAEEIRSLPYQGET